MKKVFILILVLCLMLCGCSDKTEKGGEYVGENLGTRSNFSLNLEERKDRLSANTSFAITDELAIEIGNAILKNPYNDDFMNETTYELTYIEDDGIYWFSRRPVKPSLGGAYNVAIDKKTGAIKLVWIDE